MCMSALTVGAKCILEPIVRQSGQKLPALRATKIGHLRPYDSKIFSGFSKNLRRVMACECLPPVLSYEPTNRKGNHDSGRIPRSCPSRTQGASHADRTSHARNRKRKQERQQLMLERSQEFDHFLEECYPTIEICGITFYPADILAECDPIAYRVAFNDWTDANCSDGNHSHEESEFVCDWCGLNKIDDYDEGE